MGQMFSLDCLTACLTVCTTESIHDVCTCNCLRVNDHDEEDPIERIERQAVAIAQKYLEDNLHIHISRSLPDLLTSHMNDLAHQASQAARIAAEHLTHTGRHSRPSSSPNSPAPPRPRMIAAGRLSRPGSTRTSPERPLRGPVLTIKSTASPRTSPVCHHNRHDAILFTEDELTTINLNPNNNTTDTPEGERV